MWRRPRETDGQLLGSSGGGGGHTRTFDVCPVDDTNRLVVTDGWLSATQLGQQSLFGQPYQNGTEMLQGCHAHLSTTHRRRCSSCFLLRPLRRPLTKYRPGPRPVGGHVRGQSEQERRRLGLLEHQSVSRWRYVNWVRATWLPSAIASDSWHCVVLLSKRFYTALILISLHWLINQLMHKLQACLSLSYTKYSLPLNLLIWISLSLFNLLVILVPHLLSSLSITIFLFKT